MTNTGGHLTVTGSLQAIPPAAHREWGIQSKDIWDGDWVTLESDPAWTREIALDVMRRWYRDELAHGMARIVTRRVTAWVGEE